MAILEISVVMLGLGLLLCVSIIFFVIVFIYTHLDKKFMKKFNELIEREHEMWGGISKVKGASSSEVRDIRNRIELLEQKIDILVQPGEEAKAIAKEKIKAVAR